MAIVPALEEADDDEEEALSPAFYRLAIVGGLGGLLFGFDTGVIGGVLVTVGTDLSCSASDPECTPRRLTTGEEELIVSATTVGALLGSLAAGWLSDAWGRKKVILLAAVLFALGAIEQAAADNVQMMVLGRGIVGLGVGLASMVTPVYIAELSPARFRGRLVAMIIVLITAGQVVAYIIDAIFFRVRSGWRYMSLAGAVPAIAQLVLSFSLPESPRYLIMHSRLDSARTILARLYPAISMEGVERKVDLIQQALRREQDVSIAVGKGRGFREVFRILWNTKAHRRALFVACGLQFAQQITGFNALMYYSQRLLAEMGFSHPSAAAIFIASSNFLCTLVALKLVDRLGRRPLLLRSLAGMATGLFLIGLAFLFIRRPKDGEVIGRAGAAAYLNVVCMVVFCASYALGLGNVPWILQSEIFAYEVRSIGNSLAASTNWTANLIVSATFLHLAKAITRTGIFWIFGLITLGAIWFTWVMVPETRGFDLEDIRHLFEADGSVHHAQQGLIAGRTSGSENGGVYTALSPSGRAASIEADRSVGETIPLSPTRDEPP